MDTGGQSHKIKFHEWLYTLRADMQMNKIWCTCNSLLFKNKFYSRPEMIHGLKYTLIIVRVFNVSSNYIFIFKWP